MARNYKLRTRPVPSSDRLFHYVDTREGFCQVHYKRRRADGKGFGYYCIQQADNGRGDPNPHSYRFMITSSDGEPSHNVDFPYKQLSYPPPVSEMTKRIIKWIDLMNDNPPEIP